MKYTWNGFDTNFNWRGPRGIFAQGGTEHGPHQPRHLRRRRGSQQHHQLAELVRRAPRRPVPGRMSVVRAVPDDGQRSGQLHGPESRCAREPGVPVAAWLGDHSELIRSARTRSPGITLRERRRRARCQPTASAASSVRTRSAPTTWSIPLLLNNEKFGDRVTTVRHQAREELPVQRQAAQRRRGYLQLPQLRRHHVVQHGLHGTAAPTNDVGAADGPRVAAVRPPADPGQLLIPSLKW